MSWLFDDPEIRGRCKNAERVGGGWNGGAFRVLVNGEALVLKGHPSRSLPDLQAIKATVDVARSSDWPVATIQEIGTTEQGLVWSLQEFKNGSQLEDLW